MHAMSASIHVLFCNFLGSFIFHVLKGIKDGCRGIVEIRGPSQ